MKTGQIYWIRYVRRFEGTQNCIYDWKSRTPGVQIVVVSDYCTNVQLRKVFKISSCRGSLLMCVCIG